MFLPLPTYNQPATRSVLLPPHTCLWAPPAASPLPLRSPRGARTRQCAPVSAGFSCTHFSHFCGTAPPPRPAAAPRTYNGPVGALERACALRSSPRLSLSHCCSHCLSRVPRRDPARARIPSLSTTFPGPSMVPRAAGAADIRRPEGYPLRYHPPPPAARLPCSLPLPCNALATSGLLTLSAELAARRPAPSRARAPTCMLQRCVTLAESASLGGGP
eukprot:CAMPEP_0174929518 /NCGR_PEP_ID=MMETSP1355-20121228/27398_1 /TAXON_ID=464990 /ORGANISM="Hemiselmis tepida, Strain CCMP443" /LENGTH=216 /DNA_ID=CAMNT_0016175731 /DNA_START=53 /DNA_END=699 /DNA_ORIENTATION=-